MMQRWRVVHDLFVAGGRGDLFTVDLNGPSNNSRAGHLQYMTYRNYLYNNSELSCGLGSLEYIFFY